MKVKEITFMLEITLRKANLVIFFLEMNMLSKGLTKGKYKV